MVSELQKELKQTKPFASLEEEVHLNLQRTAEFLSRNFVELIKNYQLSSVQYNVLRILRGAGENGLACSEISERLVTKDSDITRLLDRLEAREFVSRERDSKDRRIVISRITQKGLDVLKELDAPVVETQKNQLGHLGDERLKQLNELLVLARKPQ